MLKLYIESFRIFTITQGSISMFIICCIMYSHTHCDCCITSRSEFWNVWVQLVLGSQRRPITHQFQRIEVVTGLSIWPPPAPSAAEASGETWKSGRGAHCGYWRQLLLFHDLKNSVDEFRSRKNSWLRWKSHSKLIIQHRDERPWGTTLHACWRWPIRDSRSLRLEKRFCGQTSSTAVALSNLSFVRHACTLLNPVQFPELSGMYMAPPICEGEEGCQA